MSRQPSLVLITITSLLLAACGTSKEFYLERGEKFAAQGKDDDAIFQYRKALRKDPKFGQAYLRYGQVLAQRGRWLEALAALKRAVELMPDSEEAEVELGHKAVTALLANPRHPENLYQTADRVATQLLARDRNSFEGLRIRGYLSMVGGHRKEAIDSFRLALQVKPNEPDIVTMLVENLFADGHREEAEKVARQALGTIKNYSPLYDALYAHYMSVNRAGEAEGLLKLKIVNNPKEAFFVVQLADHYWGRKKSKEAEDLLSAFVANTRDYPSAPLDAGDFYSRVGRPEQALALYESGVKSDQVREKDYLKRIASVQIEQGRNQEAVGTLNTILKDFPGDTETLASRADLWMATGKPEEIRKAAAEFTTLVQKEPENNDFRYGLARAYRLSGRENESEKELLEVFRRDPNHRASLREMADLAIRNQRPDEALTYAERLLAIDPTNVGARLVRTSAWALKGRFGEVRGELLRIQAENPNLPEPQLQMATLSMEEKNYAEAERIYRHLYQPGKNDFRALRGLVAVYLFEGQAQKAVAVVREEAKRSDNVEARELLAKTAASAGETELALTTAARLAAEFPEDPDRWIFVGKLREQRGKLDEAMASFVKAEAIAPNNPLASAELGEALGQAGRYAEAASAYRRSLKLRPKDPLLMNNLAWQLAMAGTSLDEALGLALDSLKQVPDNPQFADTVGVVYLKSGQAENALKTFQGLVRREPTGASFRLHLAMSLLRVGQPQRARTELQAALRNGAPAAEAEEVRKLLASTP